MERYSGEATHVERILVSVAFLDSSETSTRRCSTEFELLRRSLQRILHRVHMSPHTIQLKADRLATTI